MFLFLAAYFGIFVSASSLLVAVDNGILLLFAFHALKYVVLCARMAQKGELFGFSMIGYPSTFNSYISPFITWSCYYLLTCAAPLLIAAVPMEFGPDIFSSLIAWSSLANGVMIFIESGALENDPYLNMTSKTSSLSSSMTGLLGGGSEGRGKGNKAEPESEGGIQLGA